MHFHGELCKSHVTVVLLPAQTLLWRHSDLSVSLHWGADWCWIRHSCRHLEHSLHGELSTRANTCIFKETFPCFFFTLPLCSVKAFELATGDYLFDPQAGAAFSREEGLCCPQRSSVFKWNKYIALSPFRSHCPHHRATGTTSISVCPFWEEC